MKIKIFGGTHGNEWTGAYLVNHYADYFKNKFPTLDLEFIFSNPKAFKAKTRFIDEDLNRAFQFLSENRSSSFEHQRAKEIHKLITKEKCFVIDLHTTTSNLGNTLIITQEEEINFQIAKFVQENVKNCRIILSPDPEKKYLVGQSSYGMMIEVGPVANNILDGIILENTVKLLEQILQGFLQQETLSYQNLEVFEEIKDIHYPINLDGEIKAYLHPELQGKDFQIVKGEFLSFKTFLGEDIFTEAKEELYPIFINEAAYYSTKLAFTLCKKRLLQLKKLSLNPLA